MGRPIRGKNSPALAFILSLPPFFSLGYFYIGQWGKDYSRFYFRCLRVLGVG